MIATVDCGDNGAIAYGNRREMKVKKMPDQVELFEFFREHKFSIVYIEKQRIWPNDLKTGAVYRVVDSLIRNYHDLQLICKITGTPCVELEAKVWQKVFNLPKDYQARKAKAKAIATKLYPGLKPTLRTADAILMMNYACMIVEFEEIDKNRFK